MNLNNVKHIRYEQQDLDKAIKTLPSPVMSETDRYVVYSFSCKLSIHFCEGNLFRHSTKGDISNVAFKRYTEMIILK